MARARGAYPPGWAPATAAAAEAEAGEVQARRITRRRPTRGLKQGRISPNSWCLSGAPSAYNGMRVDLCGLLDAAMTPCVLLGRMVWSLCCQGS
uniref:Uncharacterized protein n=1 Tax=Triticum urartu TaxID=4572 RepID=A0A8R7UYI4_TRIUA